MMNAFFILHAYLIFNIAIAIAYIVCRCVLNVPLFKNRLLQSQRLVFTRYLFVITVICFFTLPSILNLIPSSYHSNFELEPLLRSATSAIAQQQSVLSEQVIQTSIISSAFSLNTLLLIMLFAGITIYLAKYVKSLYILKKFKQHSYCQHHINGVHILYNSESQLPFCWSFMKKHYIAIPQVLLENNTDLKLAIRHELQHIRQKDTSWLHILSVIKAFCFWNPFMKLWANWLDELQEFACDESVVIRKKSSPTDYIQCLINSASASMKHGYVPAGTLGIHSLSKSLLHSRINMIFNYKQKKMRKSLLMIAYAAAFFITLSTAYALNGSEVITPLSKEQISALIQKSNLQNTLHVSATPEVVIELNNIRGSEKARANARSALQRMKNYQPLIEASLQQKDMPNDLIAIPLIASQFKNFKGGEDRQYAAGVWQIIPATARSFGLKVNAEQDERMNVSHSTEAALNYLNANYNQFNDWRLAMTAYHIGEDHTEDLIEATGSRNPQVLADAPEAPAYLKGFSTRLDTMLIIMHNPSLVAKSI